MSKPTAYEDVNDVIARFTDGVETIFGKQLAAVYLMGSLAYGDFNHETSDIDFMVVLNEPLTDDQRHRIKGLHAEIERLHPFWARRIEVPYLTRDMLKSKHPPKNGRPLFNAGELWDPDPPYGHKWLVDMYDLQESGVALFGPDPKSLVDTVEAREMQKASSRDLRDKWAPKLDSDHPFGAGEHWSTDLIKAYTVLTMCRVLYRSKHEGSVSKPAAAEWAKKTYPQWKSLIEEAERWREGQAMDAGAETLDFIRFTLGKVD